MQTLSVTRGKTDRRSKARENMQPRVNVKARGNGQNVSVLSVSKHTTSEKRGKICNHVSTLRVGKLKTGQCKG